MATYFLDTSAIIKRYIFEQGQAWILSLCNPAQGHNLYISQVALVEVVAAICRRAHEQSISMAERDRLITVFRQDGKESYNIWLVDTDLYNSALMGLQFVLYSHHLELLYQVASTSIEFRVSSERFRELVCFQTESRGALYDECFCPLAPSCCGQVRTK